MGKYGETANAPEKHNYYVIVNGENVPINPEQKKAWNEMINRNRHYARDFGICGQPDFRKCYGDCSLCPFQREGSFVYTDDRKRYVDGFANGKYAPVNPQYSVENQVADADAWDWLYQQADKTVTRGREILYLSMEEGLSAHQISKQTGIAKSTVVDRLNKLLAFIREHRDDLI